MSGTSLPRVRGDRGGKETAPQTTTLLQDWEKTLGKLTLALSEAEVTGDLTVVTKLQEELVVLEAQALELKKKFLPKDAFELVEDLSALGHRVTSTSNIHSQSDGTLAGQVMVDGKWQHFLIHPDGRSLLLG